MTASGRVRIGLTGPIGCGKSTVAGWLADLGAVVIDADAVARTVTAPGLPSTAAVLAKFGDRVRGPDGGIDRGALASIVFDDPEALAELERIVHPAVRTSILEQVRTAEESGARSVVIEAIKLVEGGLAELCDELWLVTCDPAEQRTRIVRRGTAPEDAERRIQAQGDIAERVRPAATRIVDTSGPPGPVRRGVIEAFEAARTR